MSAQNIEKITDTPNDQEVMWASIKTFECLCVNANVSNVENLENLCQ